MEVKTLLCCLLVALVSVASIAQKKPVKNEIDIPYKKFILKNGLTLIVHEDHKAPIVAVNTWYHVGSKNEKEGKTGFAHLFEHLMFNGSEHFNDDYFKPLEKVGATDMNGTTNEDRTNYFENVPTSALDLALFMESDRMGYMVNAIDQARLDEQRGVVQNEKRQGENQPYAISEELITKSTYPVGHPYSWTVIGSMEHLDAAKLTDVHDWFKTYYGPNNAVLCISGDVNPEEIKAKVEKYYGDLPPGPPISKHTAWIAKMTGSHTQIAQDRVPQAMLIKVWNVPEWGTEAGTYLQLFGEILGRGKTSRLYKRLVYDEQIATEVSCSANLSEIAGQFYVQIIAKPGMDLEKIKTDVDEELAKILREGITEKELKRVQTNRYASFVRGIERIGGFGGKSDILAMNQVYGGSPDYYKTTMNWAQNASIKNINETAKEWLSDGVYNLEIYPYPKLETVKSDVDRKKLPDTKNPPEPKFVSFTKKTLSNGLKVVLAERHNIPVVNFNLVIDAGFSADQFATPGTANLLGGLLDEGTKTRNSLQISDELQNLGANLYSSASLDYSNITLSALKMNLDKSLEIFTDILLNPSFPQSDFDRLKKTQLAGIKQEKSSPRTIAMRVFPKIVFGENHAYGNSFTGSGTEETVEKMSREDMMKFYNTWYKPNNSTLVIVGDVTMDEIVPQLEKLLKNWKGGDVPKKNISPVENKAKSVFYLIDKPGAQQSEIYTINLAPPANDPNDISISLMNYILGGAFTSRINMNLREDKHWSYGARSMVVGAKGQRPFMINAPVQTDKTKESILEIYKELKGFLGEKPVTDEELQKVKQNRLLSMPGNWETNSAVMGSLVNILTNNLPDNYYETYVGEIKNATKEKISKAASITAYPDNMVWVIIGDVKKIEAGVKETNLGEVNIIDADGKPVK
jgi:zinc protease